MKAIRQIITSFLIISLLLPTLGLGSMAALAGGESQKSISNNFMTFSVNEETGFFNISTLEGHPQKVNDNNIDLLYSGDSIETSFVTVRIDGRDYIFGQDYSVFAIECTKAVTSVDAVNNSISTVWSVEGVKVTQTAFLSRTDNTMRTGNVSLTHKVENTDGKEHNVGIRVMFDNSLGVVDAPVTMTANELAPLMKETEFFSNGKDPGEYIRHIDSFDNPTKETFFMFDPLLTHKPDKMIVGHWYNLASTKWDYKPDGNMSYASGVNDYKVADTATALYWNETALASGANYERTLLYGVGDFTVGAVSGNFNITLEIDDTGLTFNDKGEYIDNTATAKITVYNNVDGSVDLDAPSLTLRCDDGAFFIYENDNPDKFVGFQDITVFPGYIKAGTVQSFEYEIAVEVPEELKTISVVATLMGNKTTDKATAKQFVLARAPQDQTSTFSISEIGQDKYHKWGNRVLVLKGNFDTALLQDRTKWKTAFVSKTDPNLRYEVPSGSVLITSEEDMNIIYGEDMVMGQYDIEFKFFDDYIGVFGDMYKFGSFEIVDDKSLVMSNSSHAAIVRRGTGLNSKYSILTFHSRELLQNAEAKLAPTDEFVVILSGDFDIDTDESGEIRGLTFSNKILLNDVVAGKGGSRLECFDDGKGRSGVRLTGNDGAYSANMAICIFDNEWKLEFENGFYKSLTDKSIQIEPKGFTSSMVKIALGLLNLQLGILGKGKAGYTLSASGSINILGYDPTSNSEALEKSIFGRSGKGLNLTCNIDNVLFDKDGFVGIDTTIRGAWTSTNILGGAQYDKWNFQLDVDTISKDYDGSYRSYGFSATVTIRKKLTVTAGGRLREVEFDDGDSMVLPDAFKLNFAVTPTSAVPFVPAIFELYMLGIDLSGLLDMNDDYSQANTPEERRLMANQATTNISVSAGFVLFEVILLNGVGSVGTNHINLVLSGSCLLLPGITETGTYAQNWKLAIHDHDGRVISPTQYTLVMKSELNFIDIFKGGKSFSYSYVDKGDDAAFLDENKFIFNLYGGLYVPKVIPVAGGLEIFGASGTFSTDGVLVVGTLLGSDIGFSYIWGEDVQWELFSAESGETEPPMNANNMQKLYVKTPEAQLFSAGSNFVSGVISGSDDYTGLIGINYVGKAPDVSDLKFAIDGKDYPLTLSDSNYQNGNCFVVADTGEGGRILVGVTDMPEGDHAYTLSAPEDIRLINMEAVGFTKIATPTSVKANGDGTVSVLADRSLRGSTVELYYINDKEAYENIKTEEYTNENGETAVKVYKEKDGKQIELGEEFYSSFAEHRLASTKVNSAVSEVTLVPEIPSNAQSGDYYLMALVRSPYGKLSRVISENSVHYENTHQPKALKGASLVNAGNGQLRVEVDCEDDIDYTGYFISLYNETDEKYEFENQYASSDTELLIEKHLLTPGKKYHAEVTSVNVYGDDKVVEGADTFVTQSVVVRQPSPVNVVLSLKEDTTDGKFTDTDGEVRVYPYISGQNVTLHASASENVKGRFVVDSVPGDWSAESHNEFVRRLTSLSAGKHSAYFEAMNEHGDISISNTYNFIVSAGEPSVMLEDGAVTIENGKIRLSGNAFSSSKIIFMDKEYEVSSDGSFAIEQSIETTRYVESYPLTAIGFDGAETTVNVIAVNSAVKPIDSIVLKANGENVDELVLTPGDTAKFTAVGSAEGTERDMGDEIEIIVHEGNSLVKLDADGNLKALSAGVAYVKASYNLGSRIDGEKAKQYAFEDIVKVSILPKTKAPTSSIPDGASVEYGKKLTLSGNGNIYYTIDGTDPTTASTLYTEAIKLPKGKQTVKAIAVENGCSPSDVVTFVYNVKEKSAGSSSGSGSDMVISGSSTSGQAGVLTPGTHSVNYGFKLEIPYSNGEVYYTTDGTTPNKNSIKYEGPIRITENTLLRAVIRTDGDYYSDIYEYDIRLAGHDIYFKSGLEKGSLINGYPDMTFRPDNAITRAETATILRRASEMYGYHIDASRFPDVKMWAKDAINELAAADIVTGYPDATFRPDNTVTRAEFVAMLMRINGNIGTASAYTDTREHWAEGYIAKASEYGYITGYSDGTFRPDSPITRAEAIAIVSRVFGFDSNGTTTQFTDVTNDHWAFGYIAD